MRINSLVGFLFLCCIVLSSCDDDLRSIGEGIQPGKDDVKLEADSINVAVKTISMDDAIYLRSTVGLLGRYQDDMYGTVQSEYLTEMYCPDTLSFRAGFDRVDSTKISVAFYSYTGDSIAPMGASFYQINNKLERNYYSNIDVSNYCDLSKPLASTSYTIKTTPYESASSKVRVLETDMGDWGQKLYEASKTSSNPLLNSKAFREYFPGVYVKPSFGNGSMIEVLGTSISVYYTTKKDTVVVDVTTELKKDSVMYTSRTMSFSATSEVIQLNKVQNKLTANLLAENTGAVYIKSPAGVCVEIELPIKDIISKAGDKSINLARLRLKGFTEIEQKNPLGFGRASTLLLINKDSVKTFFENPYREEDLASSLIYPAARDVSTNTYTFNNLAPMIKEYKDKELEKNPTFVLIPVTPEVVINSDGSSKTTIGYFNSIKPALTVIRAREGDIKMEMVYSSF